MPFTVRVGWLWQGLLLTGSLMSGQPSFHLRERAVVSVRFPPHPVLSLTREADIMKDVSWYRLWPKYFLAILMQEDKWQKLLNFCVKGMVHPTMKIQRTSENRNINCPPERLKEFTFVLCAPCLMKVNYRLHFYSFHISITNINGGPKWEQQSTICSEIRVFVVWWD